MRSQRAAVAGLLFASGYCALVYQTVWMREFRLIFGASTSASAAVLAVFMGGLGVGSWWLGPRADRSEEPLRMYGWLELKIAFLTALTPLLIAITRHLYLAIGGSTVLGAAGAAIVRLLFTVLVIGFPAVLMGATLPAAVRAIETPDDIGRRRLAFVYAANTFGAATGAFVTTFYLLEHLGNRGALWSAVLINLTIGMIALVVSSLSDAVQPPASPALPEGTGMRRFVFVSAGVVGFAFFVAELVWYRMLSPLLGGTAYTFGLILAVALAGIAAGGLGFSLIARDARASLAGFSVTCGLEALLIAVPIALGDRVAVLAALLRSVGAVGFYGYVIGWTLITSLVVLPAAILSGIQFPLLVSLLGRADERVGRDVGYAYAWNTAGAILGSLAGGFGLLPLLSATRTWSAIVILLALLSVASALVSARRNWRPAVSALIVATIAIVFCFSLGPTAAWREGGIGAGRSQIDADATTAQNRSWNDIRDWLNYQRRILLWERDGVESTIALTADQGYAFVVNGKIDGHARFDAGTQVMMGLVGALAHPHPRSAFVLGLGTGSTAGWLAAVNSIDRVDVAELEPAVIRVAEDCAPVNHSALSNRKVHVLIGDGRELLLTSPRRYDVIASEPSNPYRAGVGSLFTAEFYSAVASRLSDDGVFVQWVQAYEVDVRTLRSIYATMQVIFPNVQTWESQSNDLLLVASRRPIVFDGMRLRRQLAEEPFRSAALHAWRVEGAEGFLSHYVGGQRLAAFFAANGELNTDNRTVVEFGFARSLGGNGGIGAAVQAVAMNQQDDSPAVSGGFPDKQMILASRASLMIADEALMNQSRLPVGVDPLSMTLDNYLRGDYRTALRAWDVVGRQPWTPSEILVVAESYADSGSDDALPWINRLRQVEPIDADLVLARLRWRQDRPEEAAAAFENAFIAARTDPWGQRIVFLRGLDAAARFAGSYPAFARRIYASLEKPLAVRYADQARMEALVLIGTNIGLQGQCSDELFRAIHSFEPHVPWRLEFLQRRAECYHARGASEEVARRELEEFREHGAPRLTSALPEGGGGESSPPPSN